MVVTISFAFLRALLFINVTIICRCDGIPESEMLLHLQVHGRRYEKIDLRGFNKITGVALFRECEKRALSEGMIKSDAKFSRKEFHFKIYQSTSLHGHELLGPTVDVTFCRIFGPSLLPTLIFHRYHLTTVIQRLKLATSAPKRTVVFV